MKLVFLNNGVIDLLKSPFFLKISVSLFLSLSSFFLGLHYSSLSFSSILSTTITSTAAATTTDAAVYLSPNLHKTFNVSSLPTPPPPPPLPPSPSPPPSPPHLKRFGVVDENGTMTDDFEIGEYDPTVVEDSDNGTEIDKGDAREGFRVRVSRFPMCPESLREVIPCMDNVEAIKKLNSTENGEKFERHCPESGKGLICLVPPPKNYRSPIPWPRRRDEV